MHRFGAAILLICIGVSSARPQQPPNQTTSASTLKARIPRANVKLYRSVQDGTKWKNPRLIVNEDGVQIRKSGDDYAAPIVPVSDVLGVLEKLPNSAWPYGLVVAVQENGICCRYSDGDAKKRANTLELLNRLKEAGITVSLWPSA